jgi:O-succinylbenzoic acid--CoA ligase
MTYGASETCGGILWNKTLLGDSQIEVDAKSQIWVTGSTIATGYRDGTIFAGRWNSGDIGTFANNELRITGRVDRVIKTNGNKLSLDQVTSLAQTVDGVTDAFAVGTADAEAGQVACVAYVGNIAADDFIHQLKSKLETNLPLKAVQLESLPLLLNGKPDAAEITRICETSQL